MRPGSRGSTRAGASGACCGRRSAATRRLAGRGRAPRSPGPVRCRRAAAGARAGRCASRGEHDRVAVVGFAARDGVPVPVAGHSHRIDRVDVAAGGAQARSAARASVSIATGIGCSALSPWSASRPSSAASPAASSLIRRRASSCPSRSASAMSWWSSAQSMPQNTSISWFPRFLSIVLALSRAGHARSLMEGLKGTAIRLAVRDPSCPQGPGPGWSSRAPVKVEGSILRVTGPRPPIPAPVPGFPVPGRRVAHDHRGGGGRHRGPGLIGRIESPVYGADHPAPAAATAPGPAPLT